MVDIEKPLTAECVFCGKTIYSLYQKQLDVNLAMHELYCPERPKKKADLKKRTHKVE